MTEPQSKMSYSEMGWSDRKFQAAMDAARNYRQGHDEPIKHHFIERMDKKEAEDYLLLVDGWQQAYEYARESGQLYHPTAKGGDPLVSWEVTPKFQDLMDSALRLNRAILHRVERRIEKLGGSHGS